MHTYPVDFIAKLFATATFGAAWYHQKRSHLDIFLFPLVSLHLLFVFKTNKFAKQL